MCEMECDTPLTLDGDSLALVIENLPSALDIVSATRVSRAWRVAAGRAAKAAYAKARSKPPHPQGFAYVENLQENPVNVLAELYLDEQVACLTWVVDDFSKIENTSAHVMPASGPMFTRYMKLQPCNWRIALYPFGNVPRHMQKDPGVYEYKRPEHLAIYLEVADAPSLPQGWSQQVVFRFDVLSHQESTDHKLQYCCAPFGVEDATSCGAECGFDDFLPLASVKRGGAFLTVDDKLTIVGRVRINTLETHRRCYRAISLRYNTAT